LNTPETTEEKNASNSLIIRRISTAFWRLGIIEIAKLFLRSRNQQYNLIDYIGELKTNYDQYLWLSDLPRNKLNEWLSLLNSESVASIRRRVHIQRNEYFAHTDRNPSVALTEAKISFDEIYSLIELTESIMFDIKGYCFRTHSDFEVTGLERAGDILLALAALKEKREAVFRKEWDDYMKEIDT
jgi:hypothetical protein